MVALTLASTASGPMGIILRALTSDNQEEVQKMSAYAQGHTRGYGLYARILQKGTIPRTSQEAGFAWANTLFGGIDHQGTQRVSQLIEN